MESIVNNEGKIYNEKTKQWVFEIRGPYKKSEHRHRIGKNFALRAIINMDDFRQVIREELKYILENETK